MIAALIIADGKSPRGYRLEPEKEIGTIPAIRRIVMIFQRAGIDRVVVVCDGNDDKAEKLTAHMNAVYIHRQTDAGFIDNVKEGIGYLWARYDTAVIAHSNAPLFTEETVKALMAVKGAVCVPFHNRSAGYPILLRSEHFNAVLSFSGEGEIGLSEAVKAAGFQRVLVEVDDEGVLANVPNDTNLKRLIDAQNLRESKIDARLRIVREKPFYDPGTHMLLQLIEEERSLLKTKRNSGDSLQSIISGVNETVRGWFEYFKHSHWTTFKPLDGWIRMRLRSIQRKRIGLKGRGRGRDNQRWTNDYFAGQGLYSLVTAHVSARQSCSR